MSVPLITLQMPKIVAATVDNINVCHFVMDSCLLYGGRVLGFPGHVSASREPKVPLFAAVLQDWVPEAPGVAGTQLCGTTSNVFVA